MTAPSLLILGADAVLAAKPATPVQLAHAALAAGYQAVVPATWGDELIAARVLDKLRESETPRVQCSCPLVARRLALHADAISGMVLTMVPPPVAAALYLRALYAPKEIRVSFAGSCPSAGRATIDAWIQPNDLLKTFEERGIVLSQQPTEFDSVLPPDRRRFYSEPGGVPSQTALRNLPVPVEFQEVGTDDFVADLAQHLLSSARVLVDVAPALGCACSGVYGRVRSAVARRQVCELEPPRARTPVVDHSVTAVLDTDLPAFAAEEVSGADPHTIAALTHASRGTPPVAEIAAAPISTPATGVPVITADSSSELSQVALQSPPRRPPAITPRAVLGTTPNARVEMGRQLPRAYVARRRSSPRGVRASAIRGVDPTVTTSSRRVRIMSLVVAGGLAGGIALGWLLSTLF